MLMVEFFESDEVVFRGSCSPEEEETLRYVTVTRIRFNISPKARARGILWNKPYPHGKNFYVPKVLARYAINA